MEKRYLIIDSELDHVIDTVETESEAKRKIKEDILPSEPDCIDKFYVAYLKYTALVNISVVFSEDVWNISDGENEFRTGEFRFGEDDQ